MQAFTDLVGTAVVPAPSFDADELTDLVPALDAVTSGHDTEAQASEARHTAFKSAKTICFTGCQFLLGMAAQASEARSTSPTCDPTPATYGFCW